jgi:hypothetical protein
MIILDFVDALVDVFGRIFAVDAFILAVGVAQKCGQTFDWTDFGSDDRGRRRSSVEGSTTSASD